MITTTDSKTIASIVHGFRTGDIKPNPDFQRRLVWTQKHKNAFIKTILDEYPFPEVYFYNGVVDLETGETQVWVVDGQQRLSTIYEYQSGSEALKRENNLPAYSELDEDQKTAFMNYKVVVRDLEARSIEEVIEVFRRINSTSYDLNPTENSNAVYDNDFWNYCEFLSTFFFFEDRRVFTATDNKRMLDVRFCISIVVTMLSRYFNLDSEHEAFLERYNEEFPELEEIYSRVEKSLSILDETDLGIS